MHDEFLKINELLLHATIWGEDAASPVLLLHGMTGQAADWAPTATLLSRDYRVIALDQRGFGDSVWSAKGAYSLVDYSADVVGLCNALSLSSLRLVGHSFGARVAMLTAAQHPDLITQLALIDSGPELSPEGVQETREFLGGMPEYFGSLDEAVTYFQPYYRALDTASLVRRLEGYLKSTGCGWTPKFDKALRDRIRKRPRQEEAPDLWEALRQVRCPALLVRGGNSRTLSEQMAGRMRAANERLQYAVVADSGHNVPGERPEVLAEVLCRFFQTAAAPQADPGPASDHRSRPS